jgi:hypothetical protein
MSNSPQEKQAGIGKIGYLTTQKANDKIWEYRGSHSYRLKRSSFFTEEKVKKSQFFRILLVYFPDRKLIK